MTPKTYIWISLWFLITDPMIFWDVGYVLMRSTSNHRISNEKLTWSGPGHARRPALFWRSFEIYERVDEVYSVQAYLEKSGFAPAAAVVNLIETSLNLLYLYFIHIAPNNIAPLFGFSGAMLTLSKTALWVLQEYFCGRCSYSAGLTDFGETFKYWIAPNVVWLTMCSLIVVRLGGDIALSLNQLPNPGVSTPVGGRHVDL